MGGSGELGHLIYKSLSKKYKVYIFDKKKRYFKNEKKIFIYGNLSKKENYHNVPKNIDIIIYLIGKKGGPDSLKLKNYKNYFDLNCDLIFKFFNKMKNKNLKKVIFFSTEHVYGDDSNIKNDLLKKEVYPKNFYGSTKLIAEKILLNYFKRTNVSVDIFRIPRIIQDKKDLISIMINQAFKSKKIIINQSKASFYFLHKDDLLSAVNLSIKQNKSKFRIFNLFNNSKSQTLRSLAKDIKSFFKDSIKIKSIVDKNFHEHNPVNHIISNKEAKKKLKWMPKISTKMIIQKKLIYYEKFYNS